MEYAGLIYDDSSHYLDHLAPFCSIMNWPVIVVEPELATLAKNYYPKLIVLEIPLHQITLPKYLLTCNPPAMIHAAFPHQQTKLLWLPHGNSDKGHNTPFFEALKDCNLVFVYGQKMIDFMHAQKVFAKTYIVGNFRKKYFLEHRTFYEKIHFFNKNRKTFLYAPTWEDAENNGSFWQAFRALTDSLKDDCTLLVKLHPNTVKKFAVEIEVLKGKYAQKKSVQFLDNFPPIYPILDAIDAYIGDMSSIGYDFLEFNKPMYFTGSKENMPLHQCGLKIDPTTFDFSLKTTDNNTISQLRDYTFAPAFEREVIQKDLKGVR